MKTHSANDGLKGFVMAILVLIGVAVNGSVSTGYIAVANSLSKKRLKINKSTSGVRETYSPKMERLKKLFMEAGKRYQVDPRLIYAICKVESNFNSMARSSVGAQGLMQLMPSTARELGVNPWNEEEAIDGAARHLRHLLNQFSGDVILTVAAYNAGELAVKGWKEGFSFRNRNGKLMNPHGIKTSNGLPPYKETLNYVRSVSSVLRYARLRSVSGQELMVQTNTTGRVKSISQSSLLANQNREVTPKTAEIPKIEDKSNPISRYYLSTPDPHPGEAVQRSSVYFNDTK